MGEEANLFEDSYLFSYSYKLSEEDVLHKIVLPVLCKASSARNTDEESSIGNILYLIRNYYYRILEP